jgi:hypothetical protein
MLIVLRWNNMEPPPGLKRKPKRSGGLTTLYAWLWRACWNTARIFPKALAMIEQARWTEEDLVRLKLIEEQGPAG